MNRNRGWAKSIAGILGSLWLASCATDRTPGDAAVAMDAAPVADAGPECTANDECSDGLFCNGEETCTAGSCEAGPPPDCSDALDCTVDRCNETTRSCENVAPDIDGDGSRDASCLDAEGAPLGDDCDDNDGNRFPGNPELCDEANHDEDCDETTFGRVDFDADGFLDARCCNGANCGNDCDDTRINVNLAATEACDGVDNDCDGSIDEGVIVAGLFDGDRDGFGDPSMPMNACPGRSGFVPFEVGDPTDCDDADATRNPGQVEICDMVDNDCNGAIDDATRPVPWYRDIDGDGFGDPDGGSVISCEPVADHVLNNRDCNDGVAAINPAAAETCDAIDNDCNGQADFEISPGNFEDDDNDGLPDIACGAPRGIDCDDRNPITGPGTLEACDGRDNDCDGDIDEGAMDQLWFWDGDLDGDGSPANPDHPVLRTCAPPPGYIASGGDCDDDDPSRHSRASEACSGTDIDCDGAIDEGHVCPCNAASGEADCDANGSCETNLFFDLNHCGACNNRCPPLSPTVEFSFCGGGRCIFECARDRGDCNADPIDGCETDLGNDIANCGDCGVSCSPLPNTINLRCDDGLCAGDCADGFADCDGTPGCETALGTNRNCNSCLDRCTGTCAPNMAGPGFVCEPSIPVSSTCPGGNQTCGPTCVYLREDRFNCGACGDRCPDGEYCWEGSCTMICGPGHVFCGDNCVDTTTNPQHCGGCGTFCASGVCNAGVCDGVGSGSGCPMGLEQCGEVCVDTFNDRRNCGSCGHDCGIGGSCESGICTSARSLALGPENSCLIRQNGSVACWGNDAGGRLSWPASGSSDPQPIRFISDVQDVAVGAGHICAMSESDVWCWGDNNQGQLGQGIMSPGTEMPTLVGGFPIGATFQQIEAGARHTCVRLIPSGGGAEEVWCWGDNNRGQSGLHPAGGFADRPVRRSGAAGELLATGDEFTCSGNAADITCWGDNSAGQLGISFTTPSSGMPSMFPTPNPDAVGMVAGNTFVCLFSGTLLHCWGDDSQEQYGRTSGSAWEPSAVALPGGDSLHTAVALAEALCLWYGNQVQCRGANGGARLFPEGGQPGVVTAFTAKTLPGPVNLLGGGGRHLCAVLDDELVRCWGANDFRQCGHGGSMVSIDQDVASVTPPPP